MAFPVTQWTLLAKATLSGDSDGRAAMNALCSTYWKPVNGYIRHRGWSANEAEDLTQAFFVYLMENRLMQQAERELGTFRAFLKTVLRRFLSHEWERRSAQKRGGGTEHLSFDEIDFSGDTDAHDDAEFDRQWAIAAMQAALQIVLSECGSKRGAEAGTMLAPFLGGSGELVSYEAAAGSLGLSLSAFKSEVLHWRRRLRECLRAEVRRTVSAPHELDEEFAYLRELLTG
ncbi:MAG: hypothetical protein KDN22_19180 [Verrucomicrobiae bacterium]|nr:hypothetical protein [Verrucomicrobiae bacterium]